MMREVDVLRDWKRKWDLNRHIGRVWLIDGGALGGNGIVRLKARMD